MYANEGPFVNLKANSVVGFFKSPWEGGGGGGGILGKILVSDSWKRLTQVIRSEEEEKEEGRGGGAVERNG